MDSGSSGNFISHALLKQLDVPRQRQAQEPKIETILGKPLGRGHIKLISLPITLQVGCLHQEMIYFLVLEGSTVDVFLGCPGLSQHSPEVRWDASKILRWSETCIQSCLSNIPVPLVNNPKLLINSEPCNRALNLARFRRSYLTTRHSRMCSANRQPRSYHEVTTKRFISLQRRSTVCMSLQNAMKGEGAFPPYIHTLKVTGLQSCGCTFPLLERKQIAFY